MNIPEQKRRVSLVQYAAKTVQLEKRGGEHWGRCPFHNEQTSSFAIRTKNNEDCWYCQGCNKGGDILHFIQEQDHCDYKTALAKLSSLAPASSEWAERSQRVTAIFQPLGEEKSKNSRPISEWNKFETALSENVLALDWLFTTRGITAETAISLHLGYSQSCRGRLKPEDEHARDKGWILFPRIVGDKVVAVKLRSILTKAFSQWAGMDAKALFNYETVNGFEPVFVTEGELDACVLEQAGFCAVSMPNATPNLTPEGRNRLKRATCIFLAGDNDGTVGNVAMKKLARELFPDTYVLLWPGAKDANDYFLKVCGGDVAKFHDEVERLMEVARATPIEGFTRLDQQFDEGEDIDLGQDIGRLHFPWKPVDDMHYTPTGAVVVFYSTYTGTGKTVFTTQVALHEAMRGETVVVYSPEIRDQQYLALVAAQMLGKDRLGGLDRTGKITREDQQETKGKLITYAEQERRGATIPSFYHHRRDAEEHLNYYPGYELSVSGVDEILLFIEDILKTIGPTRFVIDTFSRVFQSAGPDQTQTDARAIKHLEYLAGHYGCLFIVIGQSNKEAEGIKESKKKRVRRSAR